MGTTTGLGADPALIGTWTPVADKASEGAPGYFHILKAEDGTLTALLVSTGSEKKTGEWSLYHATTATLGGHGYLNAQPVSENGKTEKTDETAANIPILYRVGPHGRLSLYLINEDAAKKAVADGEIDGTVEPGNMGDVVLTASPDKLDAFLASDAGAALFTEKLVTLKKVEQAPR